MKVEKGKKMEDRKEKENWRKLACEKEKETGLIWKQERKKKTELGQRRGKHTTKEGREGRSE